MEGNIIHGSGIIDTAFSTGFVYRKRRVWDGSIQNTLEISEEDLKKMGIELKTKKTNKGRVSEVTIYARGGYL